MSFLEIMVLSLQLPLDLEPPSATNSRKAEFQVRNVKALNVQIFGEI